MSANGRAPATHYPLSVDQQPPSAPNGWRWVLLTELARLESGHTPSRRHPEYWGGDVPWISLADIRQADCREIHSTLETTNELGLQNSSARLLPTQTVVLSRTASVGFVSVMGRPMCTSQDFVNWVCGEHLRPWFLVFLLRAARPVIRLLSSGAIHKTVYMNTVERFRVCVPFTRSTPDLDRQEDIARELRDRLDKCAIVEKTLREQLEVAQVLPDRLVQAAFGGGRQ